MFIYYVFSNFNLELFLHYLKEGFYRNQQKKIAAIFLID